MNDLKSPVCVRLGDGKKPIVKSHFGVDRVRRADPMDRAFDLAIRGRAAGFALEIGRATQLGHIACASFTTSSHLMM